MGSVLKNHGNLACRVCGLIQCEAPWGDDGKTPNFMICACCGAEFGYEDCTKESVKVHRTKWLDTGANWWEIKNKPDHWDIHLQLQNIPIDYK